MCTSCLRDGQEGGCRQSHEDGADADGHGTFAPGEGAIPCPDGVAHGDGRRGGDPERHHVGEAG